MDLVLTAQRVVSLASAGRTEEAVESLTLWASSLSNVSSSVSSGQYAQDQAVGSHAQSNDAVSRLASILEMFTKVDVALGSNLSLKLRFWKNYIPCIKLCGPLMLYITPGVSLDACSALLHRLISTVCDFSSALTTDLPTSTSETPRHLRIIDILGFFAQRLCATLVYMGPIIEYNDVSKGFRALCVARACLQGISAQAAERAALSLDQAVLRLFTPDRNNGSKDSSLSGDRAEAGVVALPMACLLVEGSELADPNISIGALLFVHFLVQHVEFDDKCGYMESRDLTKCLSWTPVVVLSWFLNTVADVIVFSHTKNSPLLSDALLVAMSTRILLATTRCSSRTRRRTWTELVVLALRGGPVGFQPRRSTIQAWAQLMLISLPDISPADTSFVAALLYAVCTKSSVNASTTLFCASAIMKSFVSYSALPSNDFELKVPPYNRICASSGTSVQDKADQLLTSSGVLQRADENSSYRTLERLCACNSAILKGINIISKANFIESCIRHFWLMTVYLDLTKRAHGNKSDWYRNGFSKVSTTYSRSSDEFLKPFGALRCSISYLKLLCEWLGTVVLHLRAKNDVKNSPVWGIDHMVLILLIISKCEQYINDIQGCLDRQLRVCDARETQALCLNLLEASECMMRLIPSLNYDKDMKFSAVSSFIGIQRCLRVLETTLETKSR